MAGTVGESATSMFEGKKIAVVVPAYNEEKQIGRVLSTMPDFIDAVVVVDDCSPDQTSEKVLEFARNDGRVHLKRLPVNEGVGGAIAAGYLWARDNDYDVAVVMAGDGQMDPADLPAILMPVVRGEVDYAKANRLLYGDAYHKIPAVRYFGNSVLSLLTKIASGYWHVADSQAGYTAIGKNALHHIPWERMYKRYGQPNDLLVRLNIYNFRVRDVVIEPVYGVGEVSKMKVRKVVFSISFLLVKLFFFRLKEKYVIRDFHPLVFFYLLGFGFLGASVPLLFHILDSWYLTGEIPRLAAMGWTFALATGLQSICFAMWFDMETNRHLR